MIVISRPWAVYNEVDEYAADWLENLIARGLIAAGVVDRRSIEDVRPDDYRGFRQAHFFAGIGVWSYALRRSGVSDDTALWTGSCPCQPFSAAGQGGGVDDERHLWPHWFHLIRECRPDRVYGEQVASKDGLGWLDLVWSDLEEAGYAIRPTDTCSAGSGAPHIRQRLRFRADNLRSAAGGLQHASRDGWEERWAEPSRGSVAGGRGVEQLANAVQAKWECGDFGSSRSRDGEVARGRNAVPDCASTSVGLDDDDDARLEGLGHGHRAKTGQREGSLRPVATAGGIEWVADDGRAGDECRSGPAEASGAPGQAGGETQQRERGGPADRAGGSPLTLADTVDGHFPEPFWGSEGRDGSTAVDARAAPNWTGPTNGFWRDADWLFCRDGKWRPVEPGTFPLVDGAAFRMGSGSAFEGKSRQGMLKGYGNAIDAEATIDFITACLDAEWTDIEHDRVADCSLEDLLA